MLHFLHIRQFGLIEQCQIELQAGMTVFSGETGAGKSMLLGALEAVFGARIDKRMVRFGAKQAEIIAELDNNKDCNNLLQKHGIELDERLLIKRIISAEGRSRGYINGSPSPLRLLAAIGDICLDFHGQHAHQSILRKNVQVQLLDARVSAKLLEITANSFTKMQTSELFLKNLQQKISNDQRQEHWMQQELLRLQDLELSDGILAILQKDVEQQRHFARIQEICAQTLQWLENDDYGSCASLTQAMQTLRNVAHLHSATTDASQQLIQISDNLNDTCQLLHNVMEQESDAEQAALQEQRLLDIHDAMRRHQCHDITALISLVDNLEMRLSQLERASWDVQEAEQVAKKDRLVYQQYCLDLHKERKQVADQLVKDLRPFLDQLALTGMQVRIDVTTHNNVYNKYGSDNVVFLIASNIGEPFLPLIDIASGGELSRFVLALKGLDIFLHVPDLAVFDEVDSGIGGETAWQVGKLLRVMAVDRQVIVVSHLPQVAACAHWQWSIEKNGKHQDDGERTTTELHAVIGSKREDELARMLGGFGNANRQHARQLLQKANDIIEDRC
ncbi:MAG: AAA family ATPase [Mariprofundales bacterium]